MKFKVISSQSVATGVEVALSFVVSALFCIVLTSPAAVHAAEFPNVNSDLFSSERVEAYGDKYHIDAAGNILNGYRRAKGQPVDFSALMSASVLAGDFKKAVAKCESCDFEPYAWPKSQISYQILNGSPSSKLFLAIKGTKAIYDGFVKAGIRPVPEKRTKEVNLIIIVGDVDFLRLQADQIKDRSVQEFYKKKRPAHGASSPKGTLLDRMFSGTSCTVSLKYRRTHERAYIFVTPEDYELCLPRQILLVAGLSPFKGDTPSAMNVNLSYSEITMADIVFLRTLYSLKKQLSFDSTAPLKANETTFDGPVFHSLF